VEVLREGEPIDLPGGSAVAVGTFDGVHVGHRALLYETCRQARNLGVTPVVAIFDRHPATVVRPETAPRLLTDLGQRIRLLSQTGIEVCYVVRFDEERSLQEPEQFVDDVVIGSLNAKAMIVGEDFHFGRRRRGDTAVLADLEATYGFKVLAIPLVGLPNMEGYVSATRVREALVLHDIELATALLGREHEVRGVVEHGDHRGRTIGFPTANVAVPGDVMLPSDGVYAGRYERSDGSVWPAAINLGKRPTFYDENGLRLLEAHLLDFDDDLYGERAKVRFGRWIRGEVKFPGIDALVEQLHRDVKTARSLLA
jgi:riboflavin kinase / FMN adenylyltransferase